MSIDLHVNLTKKRLLTELPEAEWGEEREWFDSLLIVPTRKKHDSGYAHIAVIGVRKNMAQKILAYPDDIHLNPRGASPGSEDAPSLRVDAFYPSGIIRLWNRDMDMSVDSMTSSVDIIYKLI